MDNGFIHICKTGGTTLNETALGAAQTRRLDHITALEARGDSVSQHFFLYTILRNPFEKLVSCFNSTSHQLEDEPPQMTFKDYVRCITGNDERGAITHKHWMPQSWWIKDKEGRVIVDYIGHTETLMKSINEIAEILEVSLSDTGKLTELQRERASKSQWWKTTHYSQHYDDECRKWAEEYYAEDLDFLNVKFERATDKTKF